MAFTESKIQLLGNDSYELNIEFGERVLSEATLHSGKKNVVAIHLEMRDGLKRNVATRHKTDADYRDALARLDAACSSIPYKRVPSELKPTSAFFHVGNIANFLTDLQKTGLSPDIDEQLITESRRFAF